MSIVCQLYVLVCHSYVFRMSLVCHSYATPMCPYIICMYSYVIRMSLVCTRTLFVCHSYLLVCNGMSLVSTRMSFVCHSFALVCHPYVTRMYSDIVRMSLVCTRMSSACQSYVLVHSFFYKHGVIFAQLQHAQKKALFSLKIG